MRKVHAVFKQPASEDCQSCSSSVGMLVSRAGFKAREVSKSKVSRGIRNPRTMVSDG